MADKKVEKIENEEKIKVVEKKPNKFIGFIKDHIETIITGVTCAAAFGTLGYIACMAVHHEPKAPIEESVENLLTPEVSTTVADAVPVPENPTQELDNMMNPNVA